MTTQDQPQKNFTEAVRLQFSSFIQKVQSEPVPSWCAKLAPESQILTYIANLCNLHGDLIILGALTGISQGFMGIGGGIAMTTYFTFQAMPQHSVIATALCATFVTNISATAMHLRNGNIRGNILGSCAIAAASGTAMTFVANYVALDMKPDYLQKLLGCAIMVSALGMLR